MSLGCVAEAAVNVGLLPSAVRMLLSARTPVFRVCDGARRSGLDIEMVEAEVVERGVGIGADFEGSLGAAWP